jgi:hypothetical protein
MNHRNSDETLTLQAAEAYEAIRALNHATITAAVPAPLAYDLLGDLSRLGHALDQLARQIAAGLVRSLAEYDVYDDNRVPAVSVGMAVDELTRATSHARCVGVCLADAQAAISQQGYHRPTANGHDR